MTRVHLTGRLICATEAEMEIVRAHLPEHIRLSRAEPGCLRFDVTETPGTMEWHLDEIFADDAAFDAHQARTRASHWGKVSADLKRDFTRSTL